MRVEDVYDGFIQPNKQEERDKLLSLFGGSRSLLTLKPIFHQIISLGGLKDHE